MLLLPADTVRHEMARCPKFACRLAKLLAGQFRVALRHIKDLKTRTALQRLAAYLIRLVDEKGSAGGAELPFSKSTLASRLAMTPETLSRCFQVISSHGILVRGHRVIVTDRAEAERFCGSGQSLDGAESALYAYCW